MIGSFDEDIQNFGEGMVKLVNPESKEVSVAASIMDGTFFQSGSGFSFAISFNASHDTQEIEIRIAGNVSDKYGNSVVSPQLSGASWPIITRDTEAPKTTI